MEHQFSVPENEAGERVDKWLLRKLPAFSRKQIKALLDDGRVLINRRRVLIAGWEVEADDSVEVRVPEWFEEKVERRAGEGAEEGAGAPRATRAQPAEAVSHPVISSSIDR